MNEDILKLIPEIKLIDDPGLRELTLTVWAEAVKRGGWTADDLLQMPFTLLIKNVHVSLIDHTRAVTRTSLQIAEVLGEGYKGKVAVQRDVLLAGAILHDVGKLLEYRKEGGKVLKSDMGKDLRHPFSGTALAFGKGLPSAVCHLIAVHAKEGDGARRNPEAHIIHHADFANFESLKVLTGK